MKLTKGEKYNISTLTCIDWTEGDGTGHEGYNYTDYFRDGSVYLGPDEHGIEPLFEGHENTIQIADIDSAGIRAQCESEGITEAYLIGDNGKMGDQKLTAYNIGFVRVIATNGDPVWEEADPEGFASLLAEINVIHP